MTNFIQNVLQISITMAAVIGVLLLLMPVWQKRYSAKWRKAIWLIIAVRLLVPFSIELPTAPVQMNVDLHETVMLSSQPVPVDTTPVPAIPSQIETPNNVTVSTTVNNITPTITTEKALMLDRGTVLFAIWLVGILAFSMYHAVQYRRFYGKIMASAKPLEDSDELLERAGNGMGLMHYPNVLLSSGVQSPMLIGFAKPTIVLPYKLYGENELVMILRHELTHYKHHDLWYKLILLCANALHWFNPLVWLMNRQAGRDVEQVCDDYVVDGMDMEYRKAYSMTILNTMASQKGVALSTHLSKDAQNTKKRFAGILQPKTHKKGIAVFAAVLILAVGISGCLQVGKVDEGVALYEKVAEYLPDNAIRNPEVYEVQGADDDESFYITYMWKEDPYEVPKGAALDRLTIGSHEIGDDGKSHYYQYKRALHVLVDKNSSTIIGVVYDRDERGMVPPTKPPEIARNQEVRDAYVQNIVKNLCGIEDMKFQEGYVEKDKDGNVIDGYYYHGTIADEKQYQVHLNYQYGYLMELYHFPNSALDNTYVEETFMLEGMEETVELAVNREPGYYAMYTDDSIFHRVPQERTVEGAFLDKYLRRVEPSIVQCYIQVGYEPNITIEAWLDEVNTNDDYAQFRPQTNPLALYEATEWWEPTGNDKVFPNVPNYFWKEYIAISGAYNVCYLTPYRDGVMIVQISHPFGAEDFEGMGSRMAQMIDTLVLATEGEEYAGKKQSNTASNADDGIALYNQIAPFLPEHAVENVSGYQRTRHTDYTEYVWGENPFAVYASSTIPPKYQHPYGLMVRTDNDTGAIRNYHYWYDETQITFPAKAENYNEVKAVGTDLAKQFMQRIVPNGENLSLDHGVIQMEHQSFTAIDKELHRKHQISVNGMYGYIKSYSNAYYNAEYMDVAQEWLYEEFRNHLGDDYRLYSAPIFIDGGSQTLKDDVFTWNSAYTMQWWYQPDREEQEAINKLKETAPEQYELLKDCLDNVYVYSGFLKLTGNVKTNGALDESSFQLYTNVNHYETPMESAEWEILDDTLQIIWTAASYINAWQHGYTELMALFGATEGVTAHQGDITINQYELVKDCLSALHDYQGDDTVQLEVPLTPETSGKRIVVSMEKKGGQWYVNATPYYFYTGYMHELTDWDNAETVWMADYDGDNTPDPVWRTWDSKMDVVQYTVELTDSVALEIGGHLEIWLILVSMGQTLPVMDRMRLYFLPNIQPAQTR